MSFSKILIHAVWGTKNHFPFLTDEIRVIICNHIKENAKRHNIFIDTVDGYTDHIHCLFYLNSNMTIEKAIQLLKGESSHWINKQGLLKLKFEWADEYYAVSVSESALDSVRAYIRNQKVHHTKITFKEECEKFFIDHISVKDHG